MSQPCRWNCMNAAIMRYDQPDRTAAGRDLGHGSPPGTHQHHQPQTVKHQNAMKPGIHCVRAHWFRGFMAFRRARHARTVMLVVPMCPESVFGREPPGPGPLADRKYLIDGAAVADALFRVHATPTR